MSVEDPAPRSFWRLPGSAPLAGWLPDAVGTSTLVGAGIVLWAFPAMPSAVVLALFGFTLITAAWSPSAAAAACLVATPTAFYLHRLPWGSFSLLELAITVGVGGYGLRRLLELRPSAWLGDARTLLSPPEIMLPVAALVAVAGVSLLTLANAAYLRESLREVRVVIIGPIAFFGLARLTWQDGRARLWAAACLVGVGTVVAAGAVVQAAFGLGGVDFGPLTRATVSYSHPNNLALFLERTVLFTAGGAVAFAQTKWSMAVVLIQVAGVVATFSRGALVALLAGAIVMLWWKRAARLARGLGFGAVAVAVVFAFLARDRLLDAGGSGDEPTRFALWRASLRMVQDAGMTGVGPDQFLYQHWRRYVEPAAWPERYTSHPHNIVLDIWLRLGVAGLAVSAWLVAGVSREVWRIRHSTAEDRLALGAFSALVGGLVHGMVDNSFFLADLAVLTWAFIAWLITARTIRS